MKILKSRGRKLRLLFNLLVLSCIWVHPTQNALADYIECMKFYDPIDLDFPAQTLAPRRWWDITKLFRKGPSEPADKSLGSIFSTDLLFSQADDRPIMSKLVQALENNRKREVERLSQTMTDQGNNLKEFIESIFGDGSWPLFTNKKFRSSLLYHWPALKRLAGDVQWRLEERSGNTVLTVVTETANGATTIVVRSSGNLDVFLTGYTIGGQDFDLPLKARAYFTELEGLIFPKHYWDGSQEDYQAKVLLLTHESPYIGIDNATPQLVAEYQKKVSDLIAILETNWRALKDPEVIKQQKILEELRQGRRK